MATKTLTVLLAHVYAQLLPYFKLLEFKLILIQGEIYCNI